jgi:hypothetical protein
MNELKSGMLVQHASLGLGKLVAVEPDAVHVFFESSESRFATKLRLPMAASLLTPSKAENAWLRATAPFTLDAKSGSARHALPLSWVGEREAMARFGEAFPHGFGEAAAAPDGGDKRERAARWRAAQATFSELLGGGEGERLLEAGKLAELAKRALKVEKHVSVLHLPSDKQALAVALQEPSLCAEYFGALFSLLAAPAPAKAPFEELAKAVAALPHSTPGAPWVATTLLPAIAQPERHVFLRPRGSCDAAHRLGFDLKFDATPNWRTYDALLDMSKLLLEVLRPHGARDHVDVDSFVQSTSGRRGVAAAAGRQRSAP